MRLRPSGALLLAALAAPGLRAETGIPAPKPSFEASYLDTSVNPCDDFYQYACGGWMKANPIPDDKASFGRFYEVYERNRVIARGIIDRAVANRASAPAGSPDKLIGDYYAACMDESAAEKQGLAPLQPGLQLIAGIAKPADLLPVVGALHRLGTDALFAFGSTSDAKDSTSVIAGTYQGGLGLPERDYYLKDDAESKKLRAQYRAYLAAMFRLLGDKPEAANAAAGRVLALETKLARAQYPIEELRDPQRTYNKVTLNTLREFTPNLDWNGYLKAVGVAETPAIDVGTPAYYTALNGLVASEPLRAWKDYLRMRHYDRLARRLDQKTYDTWFGFNATTLNGIPAQEPRWKRCVNGVNRDLGEVIGRAFVDAAFPPESKARMLKLVNNLYGALDAEFPRIAWMDPATREAAAKKLATYGTKIGYPDRWRDYSALAITGESWAVNSDRIGEFEWARDMKKIGQPIDRGEWLMSASDVNAYYRADRNEIVFPAGILQPPFFDPKEDDAFVYGAIGMVIGHEITHGFDDGGRQFDPQGNLRDWWSAESAKNYEANSACIEQQYSVYEPVPGAKVNGKLTLGENIADLGGMKIAYRALERSFAGQPPAPKDGFTWQQRFFFGTAMAWCSQSRPEALKQQVMTDPHSPDKFRINGPLSNLPEFREAFQCKAGQPMVRAPEQMCKIW